MTRFRRTPTRELLEQVVSTATPMSMSLEMLRKFGYKAYAVEVNNIVFPGASHSFKKDLLGFADILALKDHVLLVQTTSRDNVSARVRKIQHAEAFEACKRAGVRVHVHGWGAWGPRVVDMTARDADGAWIYPTLFDFGSQSALEL